MDTESGRAPFPFPFPLDTEISEVDLDEEEVYYQGERLTEARSEQIAEATLKELDERGLRPYPNLVTGRKSLTGGSVHSPRVQFRVPEEIRERAERRAREDRVSLSVLARRALEQYLA